jgi:hypothetical protein
MRLLDVIWNCSARPAFFRTIQPSAFVYDPKTKYGIRCIHEGFAADVGYPANAVSPWQATRRKRLSERKPFRSSD